MAALVLAVNVIHRGAILEAGATVTVDGDVAADWISRGLARPAPPQSGTAEPTPAGDAGPTDDADPNPPDPEPTAPSGRRKNRGSAAT
jgi:hypothetical protein